MGGGAVAVEMATAYSAFGSKITLITTASQLVPRVDQEPSRLLKESLEQRGVEIHLNASTIKVQRSGSNITVNLSTGETISGTELLVAAGREAQLEQLGLDKVGLSANGQHLEVDDGLKVKGVNGTWLYAAGDINGRAPMTHSSKYHATIVANGILNNAKKPGSGTTAEWSSSQATADNYAVPQVIFTDPVVATVGLTSSAAKAKGKKVREVTTTMDAPGYMIHSGKPSPSFAQWLLDENDRLVGATFVGTDAAELLHASTVAIVGGMTLDRLMHAVPSFPTLSWVYYNLMDAAGV
jgi:dihydrolipoamide dehydrogenase